jgi:CRP-like cAMP-binding protein
MSITGSESSGTSDLQQRETRLPPENAALAALPRDAFALLKPHLHELTFDEGAVLWDCGGPVEQVFFPRSGTISIVIPLQPDRAIEVASIGHEGGAGMEYDHISSLHHTQGVIRVTGRFRFMTASLFAEAVQTNEDIAAISTLCSGWILHQAQQIAACNATHKADERFCRWLFQAAERTDCDVIPSTQETIAHLLGIRRTTLTGIAQRLQSAGVISYDRGKIMLRNRQQLRNRACACCTSLSASHWPATRLKRNAGVSLLAG